jgi:hypothetical protein
MKSIHFLLLALVLVAAPGLFASAQEVTDLDPGTSLDGGLEDPTIPLDGSASAEEETDPRFASRELLTETFLADELAAQEEAQTAVDDAQTALDEAVASQALVPELEQALSDAQTALTNAETSGTATPEELEALQQAVTDAQMALDEAVANQATPEEVTALETQLAEAQGVLDGLTTEIDETTALIDQLSDEQVFALNRNLNNALKSNLDLEYDAAMLQPIIDGDYNKHQINAYTQGLEQEARFLSKADRFQERYDETGNEGFLSKVDRFTDWAAAQRDKFMSKVDRFADEDAGGMDGAAMDTASLVGPGRSDLASGAAKNAAKQAARAAARDAAKQAAKDAASKEARRVARAAVKDTVKKAGKSAENKGKGKAKKGS